MSTMTRYLSKAKRRELARLMRGENFNVQNKELEECDGYVMNIVDTFARDQDERIEILSLIDNYL